MTPSDFSHQWCEFFRATVGLDETLHSSQIGGRETARAQKSRLKINCELHHHGLAPTRTLLTFHNQPPDVPVQADQFLVDRA